MTTTACATAPRPTKSGARGGRPRSGRPLGTTADNPSAAGHQADREDRRRARRAEAIAWRARLWTWTSLPRLRSCGRITHSTAGGPVLRVSDTPSGRRAGLAGLQSCGSPWACPVCARRIAAERSTDLLAVLQAVRDAGGCAHLVTLTMRHRSGQRLADLWGALSAAWGAVTSGRRCERERDAWGLLGWVRVVEATHGEHGWHLHVHALAVFDTPVSPDLARELGGRWFLRWSRALARKGLDAVEDRGGLDVRAVQMTAASLEQVADYLAKITAEVTAHVAKDGRNGNRTPFAILRDALATGLADDCELWLEWERASFNRRQITWSRDLRTWAGLRLERSDDEIVADELGGRDTIAIDPESWPAVRAHTAALLDLAETDGVEAVTAWLHVRGHRWSPATPRPPRDRHTEHPHWSQRRNHDRVRAR